MKSNQKKTRIANQLFNKQCNNISPKCIYIYAFRNAQMEKK